jgi:sarcosine/dimethylglycine N-methyltransferase
VARPMDSSIADSCVDPPWRPRPDRMSTEAVSKAVTRFYDNHSINEDQILRGVRQSGVDLAKVTQDDLSPRDQDHYGGIRANAVLARMACVIRSDHVLDVCSGVGGPARWLAHKIGCQVTGLELTERRCQAATRLTALARLRGKVEFRCGDALNMPFADSSFDVVVSQEAFVHVPDKPRLIRECARVVRSGGRIAFTDVVRRGALDDEELARLRDEMAYPSMETIGGYRKLLQESCCDEIQVEDVSREWARILVGRLAMYRARHLATVANFGDARAERWDRTYSFLVGLYETGQLGGVRMIANRAR